jgi:hypothetical protein
VIAVDPTEKDLVVRTDGGAQRRLDASYVAEHLQHAYALTAHTIQGATVEWAGVVGRPEDFTRNWSYTALSRAREPTELFIVDTRPSASSTASRSLPAAPANWATSERRCSAWRARCAAVTTRTSPWTASTPSPTAAPFTSSPLTPASRDRPLLSCRPNSRSFASASPIPRAPRRQLRAARSARADAERVADNARARIAELEPPTRGVLRRRAAGSAERGWERQRLKLAEGEIAAAAERERNLASSLPDRAAWDAERRALRERAAEIDAQLSSLRRTHLRVALERPAPYLTQALGALPDKPRARRTWQQAATRIEAYRFDHAVTDTRHALGSPPSDQPERAHWQRVHHDLQRAQRDLGHRRQHSHEI